MVQCSKCGYLALRQLNHHTLHEAGKPYRDSGQPPHIHGDRFNTYERAPVCFVAAVLFEDEVPGKTRDDWSVHDAKTVIERERECAAFKEWVQGHSPKEHYEMKLLQEQREYERERDKAQRDWELKRLELERQRDKDERDWRLKQARRERRWRKEDRRSNGIQLIVAAIVGVVGAIATLIAASKLPWFN